jgi:hypothetical protein
VAGGIFINCRRYLLSTTREAGTPWSRSQSDAILGVISCRLPPWHDLVMGGPRTTGSASMAPALQCGSTPGSDPAGLTPWCTLTIAQELLEEDLAGRNRLEESGLVQL